MWPSAWPLPVKRFISGLLRPLMRLRLDFKGWPSWCLVLSMSWALDCFLYWHRETRVPVRKHGRTAGTFIKEGPRRRFGKRWDPKAGRIRPHTGLMLQPVRKLEGDETSWGVLYLR